MTEQQIDRDELLAWCRRRPSDDGLTTMYNHELRYVVDALARAEARIKAVQHLIDQADTAGDWTVTCSRLQRAIDGTNPNPYRASETA